MNDFGVPASRRSHLGAPVETEATSDLVRPFVLTGGRTRSTAPELPIETVVSAPADLGLRRATLRREELRIVDVLTGPMSIAEVSAHLTIPLRAAVVLVSELVESGALHAGAAADTGDTDFLLKIRSALQLL